MYAFVRVDAYLRFDCLTHFAADILASPDVTNDDEGSMHGAQTSSHTLSQHAHKNTIVYTRLGSASRQATHLTYSVSMQDMPSSTHGKIYTLNLYTKQ